MTTASSRPLPLAQLHERLGAVIAPIEGFEAPLRYGPVEDEVRALREGCGLVDRSWAGRLELLGADRQRFLNAYLTCDVKSLGAGEGAYGFFTSGQGRLLSDAVLLVLGDRLWIEVAPNQDGPIAEHLRRYVLADRVEVRALDDVLPVSLVGPRAEAALGAVEGLPAGAWRHARVTVHGTEMEVQRGGDPTPWTYTLWVAASAAPLLIERLLERGDVRPVGFEALEILRAERGIPRFGRDVGPDNFPQETGIEEAVSYSKGCYLGQEVVARIHYRGGVQKTLCRLVFAGDAQPGAVLLHEGREAGVATTVVRPPGLGRAIGLGILHRRAADPGTRLEIEGGGTAEVVALTP